jgi:predicted RNA-binding Zn-ribbon protein involved in translation (DUF1610 family)
MIKKMENKISNKIPFIETDISWRWHCPECGEYQNIERDGDGFSPVICEACKTEFPHYQTDD